MKKIEYDLQNGIYEVRDFDKETDIISTCSLNDNLSKTFGEDFEGTRGMIVSNELFDKIRDVYGINEHISSIRTK